MSALAATMKRAHRKSARGKVPWRSVEDAGPATGAMQRYRRSLAAATLLTVEEEQRLARAAKGGDREAGRRLVQGNLRLVVKMAENYGRSEDQLMDLIQEGNLGLMIAVSKFDPDRGFRFITYAAWWIRARMLRWVIDNFAMVKIGTSDAERKLFYSLPRKRRELAKGGADPSDEQLGAAMKVKASDVAAMSARMAPELSTDVNVPCGRVGHEMGTLGDMLPSSDRPDELFEAYEVEARGAEILDAFAATLDTKQRAVFDLRMRAEVPETLEAVGKRIGITKEGARQIEARILARLERLAEKIT